MGDSNAEVSVGEGGWIRFRTTRVIASLIEKIREAMEGLLQEKIANPCASHLKISRNATSLAVVQMLQRTEMKFSWNQRLHFCSML